MTALTEKYLLAGSIAFIAIAAVADLALRLSGRSSIAPTVLLLGCATLGLVFAIAVRWIREQQGPFLTLYDVLLSNLFSLSLIVLAVYAIAPTLRITSIVVLPLFVLLGGWLLSTAADAVPLPATFDNGWLWLHVASGKIFLGLCLVAAAGSFLLLVGRGGSGRLTTDERGRLDTAIWPVLGLAFIAHSFMLIAGAVWAHSAWGRYWAWDSLETWSLITWLAIGLLMHARVTYRQMRPALAWGAVIAIFALAFLTFFGVPFVSQAPHQGVM